MYISPYTKQLGWRLHGTDENPIVCHQQWIWAFYVGAVPVQYPLHVPQNCRSDDRFEVVVFHVERFNVGSSTGIFPKFNLFLWPDKILHLFFLSEDYLMIYERPKGSSVIAIFFIFNITAEMFVLGAIQLEVLFSACRRWHFVCSLMRMRRNVARFNGTVFWNKNGSIKWWVLFLRTGKDIVS